MKNFRNTFQYLTIASLTLFTFSCSLLDDDGDGGGDNTNKNAPQLLTQADFRSDLVLENRNDGVDYLVTEDIDVNEDLEVRPGVVIEFEEGIGMDVRDGGSINAVGFSDRPIVFTGEIKSKGSWQGILVESASLKNQFSHCEIAYGGSDSWGNDIQGGLTTWAEASINVDDCTFRDNKSYGVQFYYSRNVDIRSFENNSFENNDKALLVFSSNVHQLGRGNSFVGSSNTIDIYGGQPFNFEASGESYTWKAQSVAYKVLEPILISDNNVTIEKGARLIFTEKGYLEANDGASLTAIGTPTEPIVMTGELDTPGSWPGLSFQFSQSNRNELQYVTIENAGSGAEGFGQGAIYMWADPKLKVENCTFRNIPGCVFNDLPTSGNTNLTASNNTLINAGQEFCN